MILSHVNAFRPITGLGAWILTVGVTGVLIFELSFIVWYIIVNRRWRRRQKDKDVVE